MMPGGFSFERSFRLQKQGFLNMIGIKDYQERVLNELSLYLTTLKEKRELFLDLAKVYHNKKKQPDWSSSEFNFPKNAWDELNKKRLLPLIATKNGKTTADYKSLFNGMGHSVPHICFKVPTGGGKTLLGASAVERINTHFFERNTGFILWVVPSDSIYKQTLKTFSNRDHLYREILDRAGGGKVKILQKTASFHLQDLENYLCVMLLMLQSAGRQTKETLRIFRGSGKFPSFFPEVDNYPANQQLLERFKNLDIYDSQISEPLSCSVKQSLGNVLKMVQPLIVIDEGHRAYTEKAKNALMDFNPRFILELSATPNKKEHKSNVLVSVSGNELKKEEMIKLPINIFGLKNKNWKHALEKGHGILQKLSKSAIKLQTTENRYIRPIMLIRVERTGTDQRDKKFIHSEDVREYLVKNFNVDPAEVKVKSATKDELKDEDLLSEYSRVRYIITKEALKEGWDCPFAYILTILSKTKAPVAVEQMTGRVLRQPGTRKTSMESLNQSYVVCMDQDTSQAVEGVRKCLQNEGMDGLAGDIKTFGEGEQTIKQVKIKRRKPFRGLKIFLPKVLHKSGRVFKPLSYEADLLNAIDWHRFEFDQKFILDERPLDISHTQVDINHRLDLISSYKGSLWETPEEELDFGFMCQRLSDVIPNSWDAMALLQKTLSFLKKTYTKEKIQAQRFFILNNVREALENQISRKTEKIFRKKLKNHEIIFKLVSAGDPDLNWEMAKTLNLPVSSDSTVLRRQNNTDLQLSFFEHIYKEEFKFNDLEKKVAWYLDEDSAIKWWHRIIENQDWSLQGWQKNRIYPDFLVCVKSSRKGHGSFSILETKGQHLMGNFDTTYKKKLFDLLTEYSKKSIDAGTVEIQDQKMTFDLVLQDKWQKTLNQVFRAT